MIEVDDVAKAVAFYQDVFNLEQMARQERAVLAWIAKPATSLGFATGPWASRRLASLTAQRSGVRFYSFLFDRVAPDVRAFAAVERVSTSNGRGTLGDARAFARAQTRVYTTLVTAK